MHIHVYVHDIQGIHAGTTAGTTTGTTTGTSSQYDDSNIEEEDFYEKGSENGQGNGSNTKEFTENNRGTVIKTISQYLDDSHSKIFKRCNSPPDADKEFASEEHFRKFMTDRNDVMRSVLASYLATVGCAH